MDAKILIDEIYKKYEYDREKGLLIHRKTHGRGKEGSPAGTVNASGYRYISLMGKSYTIGPLVWLLETGEMPTHNISFIDGNPNNTSFENLRRAGAFAGQVEVGVRGTKTLPSRERLEQIFQYSDGLGGLINKIDRGAAKAGGRAGCLSVRGYIQVSVDGRPYTEHRLVWWMVKGEDCEILDHVDRDKTNNKVENLRPATKAQNAANNQHNGGKLGIPGVRILKSREKNKRPYAAYLSHQGKQDHLGYYATIEEAFEVHKAAHLARYGAHSKYTDVTLA